MRQQEVDQEFNLAFDHVHALVNYAPPFRGGDQEWRFVRFHHHFSHKAARSQRPRIDGKGIPRMHAKGSAIDDKVATRSVCLNDIDLAAWKGDSKALLQIPGFRLRTIGDAQSTDAGSNERFGDARSSAAGADQQRPAAGDVMACAPQPSQHSCPIEHFAMETSARVATRHICDVKERGRWREAIAKRCDGPLVRNGHDHARKILDSPQPLEGPRKMFRRHLPRNKDRIEPLLDARGVEIARGPQMPGGKGEMHDHLRRT